MPAGCPIFITQTLHRKQDLQLVSYAESATIKERACPKCKSRNVRPSQKNSERLAMYGALVRLYRCNNCDHQFTGFRWRVARIAVAYVLVTIAGAAAIWYLFAHR